MKIQVTIPDYFTVKHYKALTHITSLDEMDQMLYTICALTGFTDEEVLEWDIKTVATVYNELNQVMANVKPEFYPIIEWKGKLYGYSSMSKMSFGEYIDLDTLTKDTQKNINQLLALLYRPVVKNELQTAKYLTRSTIKALKYDVENVFDYYTIEEYDPVKRKQVASEYDDFPAEMALGAMGFFLSTKAQLLNDSLTSSPNDQKKTKKMKTIDKMKSRLANTTAGFLRSKVWQNHPSYPLQEIKQ